MSAPILQKGDWVFFEFPAKLKDARFNVLDEQANQHVADEFTKAMNAHGVMVQGWSCNTSATGMRIVAVFRDPPPVVTVKDVFPDD